MSGPTKRPLDEPKQPESAYFFAGIRRSPPSLHLLVQVDQDLVHVACTWRQILGRAATSAVERARLCLDIFRYLALESCQARTCLAPVLDDVTSLILRNGC